MKRFTLLFLILFSFNYSCKQTTTANLPDEKLSGNINHTVQTTDAAVNSEEEDGYYRQFEGKIGTAAIKMFLVKTGNKLYGNYLYTKIGELIELSPRGNDENIDQNGNFTLFEFTTNKQGEYTQTGTFNGQLLKEGKVIGNWTSADEKKNLNFELTSIASKSSSEVSISKVEKQEGTCNPDEEESVCAHFEVIFPKLKQTADRDNQVTQLINSTIRKVLAETMPTEQSTPPDQAAVEFINDFKNQESDYRIGWEYQLTTEIYHNANNILSIGFDSYIFTGGAHPNYSESYYNFNLKNGELIELDDFLLPNYSTRLTKLIESKIRVLYNIGPNTPLSEAGFMEDKLELNNNFSISLAGITFLYNPYEIAPYVMGEQRIFISFNEIKDLVKPDGLISWRL